MQNTLDSIKPWHSIPLLLFGLLVALIGVLTWWYWDEPLASPLSSSSAFRFFRDVQLTNQKSHAVYGFLPYWNLKKVTLQPELTHVGYFDLGILADGTIQLRDDGAETPGYTGLRSDELLDIAKELEQNGGRLEIVFTQFSGADTAAFLNSPKAQEQFLSTLDTIILAYPISGVNIDIEPSGLTITDKLRANYVTFISNLRLHLNKKYDTVPLSIDVYASASNNQQIWDIPNLAPLVDYIVIMAYDYHRRSSVQAGPVAPIFGGQTLWDSDISQHLREFVKQVPPEKLLLGMPFYGYEWQTTDQSSQSPTYPDTGSTATLTRVAEILSQKEKLNVKESWNDQALAPYLSYVEDGKTYIVYYENPRSISYKLDLVNQLDLGGVAIWALGYEGEDRVLWDVIHQKIR
ncbi:hypothetical protein KA012_02340 [Candidatus Woesebacteria bacterium]|nr:hypothetical protein [Candidatus Woesebacteria bacterium]